MNRLLLDAASSLLRSPQPATLRILPPCPPMLFPSFLIPSAVPITGLSGREEGRNLSPRLSMSHPLGFVYSLEKCPPSPSVSGWQLESGLR